MAHCARQVAAGSIANHHNLRCSAFAATNRAAKFGAAQSRPALDSESTDATTDNMATIQDKQRPGTDQPRRHIVHPCCSSAISAVIAATYATITNVSTVSTERQSALFMIPQSIIPLALSALASEVAGWLKDDKLQPWQNYAIVMVFFAIAVALSVIVDGGLTGDPGRDLGLILAECTAVFAALKPLRDSAMTKLPSPLGAMAARAAKRDEMQREVAAMWAAARAAVPQRASAGGVVEGTGRAMPSQPGIDITPTPEPPLQPL